MKLLLRPGIWAALLFALALLRYPQQAAQAVRDGAMLCLQTVVPALFPFFVLCSLLISLGFAGLLARPMERLMRPLFGLPGSCASAVILGFLGGYPVGARTVRQIYEQGGCSRREAESLLSFCNNAGPGFFLGVVGVGVFGSVRVGLTLWGIHIFSALLAGLLLCRRSKIAGHFPVRRPAPQPFATALTQAVTSSLTALLGVCGFVIFFCTLLELVDASGLLRQLCVAAQGVSGCSPHNAAAFWKGLLELTAGVTSLSPQRESFVLAAGLLGFGGLSVHGQTAAVLGSCPLSMERYALGKLLQALFSVLLALPLSHGMGL